MACLSVRGWEESKHEVNYVYVNYVYVAIYIYTYISTYMYERNSEHQCKRWDVTVHPRYASVNLTLNLAVAV